MICSKVKDLLLELIPNNVCNKNNSLNHVRIMLEIKIIILNHKKQKQDGARFLIFSILNLAEMCY